MKPIKAAELEKLRFIAYENQTQGNYGVAEQIYSLLLNLELITFGSKSDSRALCLYKLAELKSLQHREQEAREFMLEAVRAWEQNYPADYENLMAYTEALAKVDIVREQKIKVLPLLRRTA